MLVGPLVWFELKLVRVHWIFELQAVHPEGKKKTYRISTIRYFGGSLPLSDPSLITDKSKVIEGVRSNVSVELVEHILKILSSSLMAEENSIQKSFTPDEPTRLKLDQL